MSAFDPKRKAGIDQKHLGDFARLVLTKNATIVTFNYDDVVDQALWEVHRVTAEHPDASYWHPDGGYGFFCRPSITCVSDSPVFMDQPAAYVLKLHGSINWYWRLGEGQSRAPTASVHHEDWLPIPPKLADIAVHVPSHLEPDPFIVPPVLAKSELTAHPVLRVVWDAAYRSLAKANRVVFIGYSLPVTDLASRFLFSETLTNRSGVEISIVNFASNSTDRQRIKDAYRSLLVDLADDHFDFSGAQSWIAKQVTNSTASAV